MDCRTGRPATGWRWTCAGRPLARAVDRRLRAGARGLLRLGAGLSASVITWLTTTWQAEHRAVMERSLSDRDYVSVWVDGVHFNVRLEEERLCCLVVVGVRLDGRKELVAIADGYRESTDSWAALLGDLRRRGMRAPVVAIGDGALGFWVAPRTCFLRSRRVS
jgi:putative transposase